MFAWPVRSTGPNNPWSHLGILCSSHPSRGGGDKAIQYVKVTEQCNHVQFEITIKKYCKLRCRYQNVGVCVKCPQPDRHVTSCVSSCLVAVFPRRSCKDEQLQQSVFHSSPAVAPHTPTGTRLPPGCTRPVNHSSPGNIVCEL